MRPVQGRRCGKVGDGGSVQGKASGDVRASLCATGLIIKRGTYMMMRHVLYVVRGLSKKKGAIVANFDVCATKQPFLTSCSIE